MVVDRSEAPVKEVIRQGAEVDLFELPVMRHHALDGGPYIDMPSLGRDRSSGVYNVSYHRMEVKDRNHTGFYLSLQHMWRIFRDYEENGEECPVAAVTGHHPAFNIGACYRGPFEADELEIIGGYLQEPLRLTPSETFGDRLMVPADAEIVIEGALIPGKRVVEGPFGEVHGYVGPQGFRQAASLEVRAITRRRDAIHQSVITPDGDKPWMDLAREGAYLRRCREAVPGVTAVCKNGRHALLNVFIAMKKMSEGDPRAGGGRGVELRSVQARIRLRRRHRRLQSHRDPLGPGHPGPAPPAGVAHHRPHARPPDRPLHGRGHAHLGHDRGRHAAAGPALLAGVQVPRGSVERVSASKTTCRGRSWMRFRWTGPPTGAEGNAGGSATAGTGGFETRPYTL